MPKVNKQLKLVWVWNYGHEGRNDAVDDVIGDEEDDKERLVRLSYSIFY